MRRKPFLASNMPAAVQRRAILASLQRFTLRQTWRMTLFIDSMMLVLANDRRSSGGKLRKRAAWVTRQQRYFSQFLPRTPERRFVAGETHLYLGR